MCATYLFLNFTTVLALKLHMHNLILCTNHSSLNYIKRTLKIDLNLREHEIGEIRRVRPILKWAT